MIREKITAIHVVGDLVHRPSSTASRTVQRCLWRPGDPEHYAQAPALTSPLAFGLGVVRSRAPETLPNGNKAFLTDTSEFVRGRLQPSTLLYAPLFFSLYQYKMRLICADYRSMTSPIAGRRFLFHPITNTYTSSAHAMAAVLTELSSWLCMPSSSMLLRTR